MLRIEVHSYPYPRSEEGIFSASKVRGMQCGCSYAESLE